MLGFKLNHVSKRGPWYTGPFCQVFALVTVHRTYWGYNPSWCKWDQSHRRNFWSYFWGIKIKTRKGEMQNILGLPKLWFCYFVLVKFEYFGRFTVVKIWPWLWIFPNLQTGVIDDVGGHLYGGKKLKECDLELQVPLIGGIPWDNWTISFSLVLFVSNLVFS